MPAPRPIPNPTYVDRYQFRDILERFIGYRNNRDEFGDLSVAICCEVERFVGRTVGNEGILHASAHIVGIDARGVQVMHSATVETIPFSTISRVILEEPTKVGMRTVREYSVRPVAASSTQKAAA
ncbi:MAG: hypothetical protein AAFY81_08430 [Pseudomonadota bacterium]